MLAHRSVERPHSDDELCQSMKPKGNLGTLSKDSAGRVSVKAWKVNDPWRSALSVLIVDLQR